MPKVLTGILAVLAVLVVGFFLLNEYIYQEKQGAGLPQSHKDATYVIDGRAVTLKAGIAEVPTAPDSASVVTTRYFGNEVFTDLNADGREDVAFLITQQTGGTGIFYYLVAALNTEFGYEGTQAVFIGDRIAPQTTNLNEEGHIVVNYADRAAGESFATQPSVGKSLYLKFDPEQMQFGEVVQDFEGEANPSQMTLQTNPKWEWMKTTYPDADSIIPPPGRKFTLTFNIDGTFSATTDCNGIGGALVSKGEKVDFTKMISTKMYCEGSQEGAFAQMLDEAESYRFTSKGELIFTLTSGGEFIFR